MQQGLHGQTLRCFSLRRSAASTSEQRKVTCRRSTITCAKKGGKKKKKQGGADPEQSQRQTAVACVKALEAPAPPRVDPNLNVSLKRQKRIGLLRKAAARQPAPSGPAIPTAFRKRPQTSEERALAQREAWEEEERRRKFKASTRTLQNIYGTKGDECPPVLLVDGYNVAFLWKRLWASDRLGRATSLEAGREILEAELGEYSAHKGIKVVCAWDAQQRVSSPSEGTVKPSTVRELQRNGIDVVYCGDQEADSFLVSEAKAMMALEKAREVLIGTNDNELQQRLLGSGAFSIPAEFLINDIRKADRDFKEELAERAARRGRGTLQAALASSNPSAFKVLSDTRSKMAQADPEWKKHRAVLEGGREAWKQALRKQRAVTHQKSSYDEGFF